MARENLCPEPAYDLDMHALGYRRRERRGLSRGPRRAAEPGRTLLAALLLGIAATAAPVRAQLRPPVRPGQRVRITLTNDRKGVEGWVPAQVLRGGVRELDDRSLLLELHPDISPARVSFSAITQLELSRGVEARWEAAWRQGKSTAFTVALNLFIYEWAADGFGPAWGAAFWGGTLGFAAGGVWGGLRPRELWAPTDWPEPGPASHPRRAR